jgi:hypothetical protein
MATGVPDYSSEIPVLGSSNKAFTTFFKYLWHQRSYCLTFNETVLRRNYDLKYTAESGEEVLLPKIER